MRHTASLKFCVLVLISLVAGVGCATEGGGEPAAAPPPVGDPDALVVTGPRSIPNALDPDGLAARACNSKINADGLVCSRCPGDPRGAPPVCMVSECFVDNHCLRCTDPKGRVARDCSIDYGVPAGGSIGGPSNGEFNFASCSFSFGSQATAGTTCQYPGANTCELTQQQDSRCLSCSFANGAGSSICGSAADPLYDPLIARPDDLPATGICVDDFTADGQLECTTCMHADLSATRSCRFPGIVDCVSLFGDPSGCEARCTFEDGHQANMCQSPRGLRPVAL